MLLLLSVAGLLAVCAVQQNSRSLTWPPGVYAHGYRCNVTLNSSADFSNSGAAASQSGFKRKSSSDGCQYLFAFFISFSASISFSPIDEADDIAKECRMGTLLGSEPCPGNTNRFDCPGNTLVCSLKAVQWAL